MQIWTGTASVPLACKFTNFLSLSPGMHTCAHVCVNDEEMQLCVWCRPQKFSLPAPNHVTISTTKHRRSLTASTPSPPHCLSTTPPFLIVLLFLMWLDGGRGHDDEEDGERID
ncbi:hypothetical protein CPSG_06433 [Coccidioides posadasii str. Silveira]|uniref:Uncharacterized protein n=1 Tax=Coccidioides posadasii (strain RMSCC 757 / Silveira) TaxID=443226 RepID=E9D9D1_COCPS|nr:hypothetical protein CPSG_06433 [Coccidioides posadasii str. Silveira]